MQINCGLVQISNKLNVTKKYVLQNNKYQSEKNKLNKIG